MPRYGWTYACYSYSVRSPESGYIVHMNAEQCGIAAVMLGAGRLTKNSPIDMTAGVVMHKKTGDFVEADEVIATLYANDSSVLGWILWQRLLKSWHYNC